MKNTFYVTIAAAALVLTPILSKAGDSDHGGDPQVVVPVTFPDAKKLESAIQLLSANLTSGNYDEAFSANFLKEMTTLFSQNKFLLVPDNGIFLGADRHQGDYEDLMSLGAMTKSEIGAEVYFAQRTVNYSVQKIAEVIAQEIPHHIVAKPLGADEEFVNLLGTLLAHGIYDAKINQALERGARVSSSISFTEAFFIGLRPYMKTALNCRGLHGDDPTDYREVNAIFNIGFRSTVIADETVSYEWQDISSWSASKLAAQLHSVFATETRIESSLCRIWIKNAVVNYLESLSPANDREKILACKTKGLQSTAGCNKPKYNLKELAGF